MRLGRARPAATPPASAAPLLCRWDLDKTYLRSEFDSLRSLLRTAFERAEDKVDVPGVAELLRGRLAAPPGAAELLFGDDWELDSLIYSLYADLVAGRLLPARLAPILRRIRVDPRLVDDILTLAGRAAGSERVARIFINLERRSPPATFRLFGPRVVPTFNYFQTAAVLGADGYLDAEDVARVGRVLLEGAGYTARRLENSLGDLVRRGVLTPAAARSRIAS